MQRSILPLTRLSASSRSGSPSRLAATAIASSSIATIAVDSVLRERGRSKQVPASRRVDRLERCAVAQRHRGEQLRQVVVDGHDTSDGWGARVLEVGRATAARERHARHAQAQQRVSRRLGHGRGEVARTDLRQRVDRINAAWRGDAREHAEVGGRVVQVGREHQPVQVQHAVVMRKKLAPSDCTLPAITLAALPARTDVARLASLSASYRTITLAPPAGRPLAGVLRKLRVAPVPKTAASN